MSAHTEAQRLLRLLEELETLTRKDLPVGHLKFLLRVYLAGEVGTTHEALVKQGFGRSLASRLMQDFTRTAYDKRTPGYDLIRVELDPADFRRRNVYINQRGKLALDRLFSR